MVDDVVLGSLCLIDFEPHIDEGFFDEAAARRLRAVARTVASHLERPCFSAWLGAAIETVREGVLLLEHAETRKKNGDARDRGSRETRSGVFDSVDEYMAEEMLGEKDALRFDRLDEQGAFAEPRNEQKEDATEKVVFANAAAKRMMRVGSLATRQRGERRAGAMFRNPSEESFVLPPPPGRGGPRPEPRLPRASRDRRDTGTRLGSPGGGRGAPQILPRRRARRGVREHGDAHAGQGAQRELLAVAEPGALRVHLRVDSDGHGG